MLWSFTRRFAGAFAALALVAAGAPGLGGCQSIQDPFAPGAPTLAQDYANWRASLAQATAQLQQLGAAIGSDLSSVNLAAVNQACAVYPAADSIFQDIAAVPGQKLFSAQDMANEAKAVASLKALCVGAPYSSMSSSLAGFGATFNVVLPLFVRAASANSAAVATVAAGAK